MNQRIILLALLPLMAACDRSVPQMDRGADSVIQVVGHETFNFELLLTKIKNCNERELTYFNRHWNEIHKQLKRSADEDLLSDLPLNQQEELWDALAYLQSCRDGNLMREHGDDIVKILFSFGTEDQLALLGDIYPEADSAR